MSRSFESFMVYTTSVGGTMNVEWCSRERYEEVKKVGRLNLTRDGDTPNWVDLKMIAFAPREELHDYVSPSASRP